MSAKKYKVGAEVEGWCTKCKLDRLHAIESLKSDGNINRVICRTCEGSHLFRRPKGDGTKKTATKRRKKDEAIPTEAELAKAKAYAMDGAFEVGEVIKHAKFGGGRVTTLKPRGKMEVAFEEGSRLLVCRDSGSFLLSKRSARSLASKLAAKMVEKPAAAKADEATPAKKDATTA